VKMDSIDTHVLDDRSEPNLVGVHPDLVRCVRLAHRMMCDDAPGLSFVVIEGTRSLERQRALVSAGASETMDSYHLPTYTQRGFYGCAIDFAASIEGLGVRWDWPLYPRIARRMKAAAEELGLRITWGGDWERLRDGPHIQIEEV
jgi:peptidoglycan LD-endopeptidase CwlK